MKNKYNVQTIFKVIVSVVPIYFSIFLIIFGSDNFIRGYFDVDKRFSYDVFEYVGTYLWLILSFSIIIFILFYFGNKSNNKKIKVYTEIASILFSIGIALLSVIVYKEANRWDTYKGPIIPFNAVLVINAILASLSSVSSSVIQIINSIDKNKNGTNKIVFSKEKETIEKLSKIQKLYDEKVITEEEYNRVRSKYIDSL